MKKIINSTWYSLPMQLLLLHFKRYQIFLIFWYILFATVGGFFLKNFGADTLFLAPEYFNKVSIFSTTIVGFSFGVFIMKRNTKKNVTIKINYRSTIAPSAGK